MPMATPSDGQRMPDVLVFSDPELPGYCAFADLAPCLPAGYTTSDAGTLADELARFDTLIWTHGPYFPKACWPAIRAFAERGGNLVALGGLPFSRPVREDGTVEPEQAAYLRELRLGLGVAVASPDGPVAFEVVAPCLPEGTTLAVDPAALGRFWACSPQLTQVSDHPDELGSGGPLDSVLTPLVHARESSPPNPLSLRGGGERERKTRRARRLAEDAERAEGGTAEHAASGQTESVPAPFAAPFVLIEHRGGSFTGGRWLLGLWEPASAAVWRENADIIRTFIQLAAAGAQEIDLRPVLACAPPGSVMELEVVSRLTLGFTGTLRVLPPGDVVDMGHASPAQPPSGDTVAARPASPAQPVYEAEVALAPHATHAELRIALPALHAPGLYRAMLEGHFADGIAWRVETGFWLWDEALVTGTAGRALTADRELFYQGGEPFLVCGTTYMDSIVQRRFLQFPNPARWDRDFAALRAAGINLIRTGVWTAWRDAMPLAGLAGEAWLRALDAFVMTACKHHMQVIFTCFAFAPPAFAGAHPWLDPRALAGQERFVGLLARRYARCELVSWDLINEPSFGDPAQLFAARARPKPHSAHEAAAFRAWLREELENEETENAKDAKAREGREEGGRFTAEETEGTENREQRGTAEDAEDAEDTEDTEERPENAVDLHSVAHLAGAVVATPAAPPAFGGDERSGEIRPLDAPTTSLRDLRASSRTSRSPSISRLALRWRVTPAELPNWDAVAPPGERDYSSGVRDTEARAIFRAADYTRWSQEAFARWAERMREVIRAAGGVTPVGVGQDEAGARPAPQFHAHAVDYTTTHPWWHVDALLWDLLLDKTPARPNLVQELGVMLVRAPDMRAWRSETAAAWLLERKLLLSLAARSAGAVQWLWHTNPYMVNENENNIGLLRVDGSAKAEHAAMLEFSRLCQAIAPRLLPTPPAPVWVVIPYAQWFARPELGPEVTQRAVRTLAYDFGVAPQMIADSALEALDNADPKPRLVIVPGVQMLAPRAWVVLTRYVERGGTLLVSGLLTRDAYDLPIAPAFPLAWSGAEPAPVSRYELLGDRPDDLAGAIRLTYDGERIGYVRKAHNALVDGRYGTGRVLWCGLPLELANSPEALHAVYAYALGDLARHNFGAQSPVLALARPLRDGELTLLVSECGSPARLALPDGIEITLGAERAGALLRTGEGVAAFGGCALAGPVAIGDVERQRTVGHAQIQSGLGNRGIVARFVGDAL